MVSSATRRVSGRLWVGTMTETMGCDGATTRALRPGAAWDGEAPAAGAASGPRDGGVEEGGGEIERGQRRWEQRRAELGAGVQLGLAPVAAGRERRKELLDVERTATGQSVPHHLTARGRNALALLHGHAVAVQAV